MARLHVCHVRREVLVLLCNLLSCVARLEVVVVLILCVEFLAQVALELVQRGLLLVLLLGDLKWIFMNVYRSEMKSTHTQERERGGGGCAPVLA